MGMDFTDNLFQSIDTIIAARIANLPYDLTIECKIVEILDKEKYKYTVQYQTAKFEAYSVNDIEYKVNDTVYVLIPQDDFTNNKFIIQKKLNEVKQETKTLSFLNFLRGNNLSTALDTIEYVIQINDVAQLQNIIFDKSDKNYIGGYTKLGIKFSINSNIDSDLKSGDYGLYIKIIGFDLSKTYYTMNEIFDINNELKMRNAGILVTKEYYIKTADMIGASLYNTMGFINQEKIFDITNFVIKSILIQLWQDGKFITTRNDPILNARITLKNLLIYCGYDIENYKTIAKSKSYILGEELSDNYYYQGTDTELITRQNELKLKVTNLLLSWINEIKLQNNELGISIEDSIIWEEINGNKVYITNITEIINNLNIASVKINAQSNFYIILYTLDGLLYNTEHCNKTILFRIIQRLSDDNTYVILLADDYKEFYNFKWGQYNPTIQGTSAEFTTENNTTNGYFGILTDENKNTYYNITDLNDYNRYAFAKLIGYIFMMQGKLTLSTNKYISNELYFINSAYVGGSDILNSIIRNSVIENCNITIDENGTSLMSLINEFKERITALETKLEELTLTTE